MQFDNHLSTSDIDIGSCGSSVTSSSYSQYNGKVQLSSCSSLSSSPTSVVSEEDLAASPPLAPPYQENTHFDFPEVYLPPGSPPSAMDQLQPSILPSGRYMMPLWIEPAALSPNSSEGDSPISSPISLPADGDWHLL
eukprot:Rmarinus@m.10129